MITVSNGEPTQKDTKMKLLYITAAILTLTLAEEEKREVRGVNHFADSVAQPTNVEYSYEGAASRNLLPGQTWQTQQPIQQINTWVEQNQNWQTQGPINTWVEPAKPAVQNDYYWQHTTAAPVIKNEIYWGNNGDYKYEYKTPDGTHVGEQGWFTDANKSEKSLVKKGWYSYIGPDGKTYTVTYWADHTGYHAYGSHLPSVNYQNQPIQTTTTTTQRPIYTTKPTYTVHPPYPTNPYPTYPPYQQPIYNQPQQQTYYPNYNV